jgi:hypothetical protein
VSLASINEQRAGHDQSMSLDNHSVEPSYGDEPGGVRNVVGIVAARLRERQNIDSGGEVNWLIDELGCECLPTIDLAHVDLS